MRKNVCEYIPQTTTAREKRFRAVHLLMSSIQFEICAGVEKWETKHSVDTYNLTVILRPTFRTCGLFNVGHANGYVNLDILCGYLATCI